MAPTFTLMSQDEGTWKELVVEEEEQEQEHLGDHHHPLLPSSSLTSSSMAPTFTLVSKDEGTWNELVVEEEEQEQEHQGDHHPYIPLLLPHLLHHGHHLHPHVPGRGHLVTWSAGQQDGRPPGGSVGPCVLEQQELSLQRGAQDRGSRSNQVTTISSYPSPSLTSFTIAATFILVSQAEML